MVMKVHVMSTLAYPSSQNDIGYHLFSESWKTLQRAGWSFTVENKMDGHYPP